MAASQQPYPEADPRLDSVNLPRAVTRQDPTGSQSPRNDVEVTRSADPHRLAAVARTGLVDAPADEVFEHLAGVAARLLDMREHPPMGGWLAAPFTGQLRTGRKTMVLDEPRPEVVVDRLDRLLDPS